MSYESYLAHHGVKGMRWGVRRYQNIDGTRTEAGKSRYSDSNKQTLLSGEQKQKLVKGLKIGAGVAVGVAAGYAVYKTHPELLTKAVSKGSKFVMSHKDDVVTGLKNAGKNAVDAATKAAVNAALTAVGSMAISELSKQLKAEEGDTERQKMAKNVALKASTAAINSVISDSKSSVKGSGKEGKAGKSGTDISKIVGAPKKEPIDKSGNAYQSLFKDKSGNTRSQDERSFIKSLASKGYSIDQIKQYLNTLSHSLHTNHTYSVFYPDELYHGVTINEQHIQHVLPRRIVSSRR